MTPRHTSWLVTGLTDEMNHLAKHPYDSNTYSIVGLSIKPVVKEIPPYLTFEEEAGADLSR